MSMLMWHVQVASHGKGHDGTRAIKKVHSNNFFSFFFFFKSTRHSSVKHGSTAWTRPGRTCRTTHQPPIHTCSRTRPLPRDINLKPENQGSGVSTSCMGANNSMLRPKKHLKACCLKSSCKNVLLCNNATSADPVQLLLPPRTRCANHNTWL